MPDAVVDSSSLIALDQIQRLDLLSKLYGRVYVVPAVVHEMPAAFQHPVWLFKSSLSKTIDVRITARRLGSGETETLALAQELGCVAILDEKRGRALAVTLGIPVIGTLGVLVAARRAGRLAVLRPLLDALVQHRFFISADLYEQILRDAGEAP